MPSLFHYTKLSTFLDYIIPSKCIKTNSLAFMNDPRECLPWSFGSTNLPYYEIFEGYYSDENHIDCQLKFGQLLKDRLQIICFSGARKEGWNNEMMWAHYSQNHEGICMEFDEQLLISTISNMKVNSEFVLDEINYDGKTQKEWIYWERSQSYEENMCLNVKRIHRELTLCKSHFWGKEDEKRLVFLNSANEVFIPLVPALKAVYIGVKFEVGQIEKFENIVSELDARLFMLIYQRNKFEKWELFRDNKGILKSK